MSMETKATINCADIKILLDSGSKFSTMGDEFYDKHCSHLPKEPLTNLLEIVCADGLSLRHLGYVAVDLVAHRVGALEYITCLLLVVPNSKYNWSFAILLCTTDLNYRSKNVKVGVDQGS